MDYDAFEILFMYKVHVLFIVAILLILACIVDYVHKLLQRMSREKHLSKMKDDKTRQGFEYKFRIEPDMDLEDLITILGTALKTYITVSECPKSTIGITGSSLPMKNSANNIENPEKIIRAHMDRSRKLLPGEMNILSMCPALINDMIDVVSKISMTLLLSALNWHKTDGRLEEMPRLNTVENCMKLSQMITQALDSTASPLQQLPYNIMGYLGRDMSIPALVAMEESVRRSLLGSLTDDEYRDVMTVSRTMPNVQMVVDTHGTRMKRTDMDGIEAITEHNDVHCPYFPDEKQEGWWLYVADRTFDMLVTEPFLILSLSEREVPLKIPVPLEGGSYVYSIILCSDSYLGVDQRQHLQLNVSYDENGSTIVEVNAQDDSSSSSDEDPGEEQSRSDSDYQSDQD